MYLFITGSNGYIGRNFIKRAVKKKYKIFALTSKKKNKKIKNVKWLVGPIDKNWKELKKADILIHFAAAGTYNKYCTIDKTFKFNVLRSSKLILNAINANCKNWLIITTNREKQINKMILKKKKINLNSKIEHHNYALTKYIFSEFCKKLSKIYNTKCKIIRLFHIYGGDEKKSRLWPQLQIAAKKNKNLEMTSGEQVYDFNYIDDVIDGLLKCLNFNFKKTYPQEIHLASGKRMSVKKFALKIWKKNESKGKILFSAIKKFDKNSYLPDKKNLFKIKFREPI